MTSTSTSPGTNAPLPPQTAPGSLAEVTTLGVGGVLAEYRGCRSTTELIDAVQGTDASGRPLLVLGGGSNLLAADEPFDGVVVRDERRGIDARLEDGHVILTVPAGQPWDEVVATAVAEGWSGIEALSGIPGSVGATPVQNVGAYGQEIAEVLSSVRAWDREQSRVRRLGNADLRFGYRTSALKESMRSGRWHPTPRQVVLDVELRLPVDRVSGPVRYLELAARLGVAPGERAPAADVRAAVLDLRRGKGMVLDPHDPDSASAGSFFTNPVLDAEAAARLPAEAPRFDAGQGRIKTSAAWLIARSGFAPGYGLPGRAALSTKHVLALTNRGGASAADLVELARTVRAGVREHFGIELVPEPVLIGLEL